MDLVIDAQDKINDAELILRDAISSGTLSEIQVEYAEEIIEKLERAQIDCAYIT